MSTSAPRVKLSQAIDPLALGVNISSTASRGYVLDAAGRPAQGRRQKIPHQFTTSDDGTSEIDPDTTGYSKAPGFLGIKAPDQIDSRYLSEDVGYTMVFFADLADQLGVPTPLMDAIIKITSVVLGRDLRREGARTMKRPSAYMS